MECDSWADLLKGALKAKVSFYRADFREANFSWANFRKANFREADFKGAYFRGADFREADFRGADFREADFREADFIGASYQYCTGNAKELKSMQLNRYLIVFNKHFLAIGCQQHSIKKWKNFTDDKIDSLDNGALEWWNKWKDFIFKAIELCYEK